MTELGNMKVDYEDYFERWNCVLFYPNPLFDNFGSYPAFQHKTCMQLTKAMDKKPPRVCVHCGADTAKEVLSGVHST